MKAAIFKLFGFSSERESFADFFRGENTKDKEKLIRKIIRESNKDQRDLVEKYKMKTKTMR